MYPLYPEARERGGPHAAATGRGEGPQVFNPVSVPPRVVSTDTFVLPAEFLAPRPHQRSALLQAPTRMCISTDPPRTRSPGQWGIYSLRPRAGHKDVGQGHRAGPQLPPQVHQLLFVSEGPDAALSWVTWHRSSASRHWGLQAKHRGENRECVLRGAGPEVRGAGRRLLASRGRVWSLLGGWRWPCGPRLLHSLWGFSGKYKPRCGSPY